MLVLGLAVGRLLVLGLAIGRLAVLRLAVAGLAVLGLAVAGLLRLLLPVTGLAVLGLAVGGLLRLLLPVVGLGVLWLAVGRLAIGRLAIGRLTTGLLGVRRLAGPARLGGVIAHEVTPAPARWARGRPPGAACSPWSGLHMGWPFGRGPQNLSGTQQGPGLGPNAPVSVRSMQQEISPSQLRSCRDLEHAL